MKVSTNESKSMAHCLIVGFGALGRATASYLMAAGHTVTGVSRRGALSLEGVQALRADVSEPATLQCLSGLRVDVLIYCVSADDSSPAAYRSAYVDGLRNVLEALSARPPLHVFFVSSTRVYGQATEAWLDESCTAIPTDEGGHLLFEGEQLLLSEGSSYKASATVLRFSGIYGPGRERLLSLARRPEAWPEQNAWSNRIHQDDGARFIAYLVERCGQGAQLAPVYIVTDDQAVGLHEVLRWIAQQQGASPAAACPAPQGGKRLANRALRQSGFELRYPSYIEGYGAMLAAVSSGAT